MSIIYCPIKTLTEEDLGEECSICRKNLKQNESIVQCSNCDTFYHLQHLQEWLKKDSGCPVCRNTIIIIDSEDNENEIEKTQEIDSNDLAKINGILEESNRIIFFNPKLKPSVSSLFIQILIIAFSLLVMFFAVFHSIEPINNLIQYQPDFQMILFLVVDILFFFSGIILFYLGLVNKTILLSNNFQTIIFEENKLIINSKRRPFQREINQDNLKILRYDILEDEIEIAEELLDDFYNLKLEIVTKNNQKYKLRNIFSNTNNAITKGIAQKIEDFVKENYQVNFDLITEEEEKRAEKKRILLLLSIAFIVFLIVSMLGLSFI